MKSIKQARFLVTIIIGLIVFSAFGQTTKIIVHDGLTREYIEYVPAIYNASIPISVIFCLHGLGDNMTNATTIGMHNIADTANVIVITPQALEAVLYGYNFGTAWNSGASSNGYVLNQDVDDIGFLMAILEDLRSLYNIDNTRIYATGLSMGGFMCHRIAFELNSTFAAIASIAGTIGNELNTVPESPMPVIHFHGTADSTVLYSGNTFGNDAEEVVEYWRAFNNCDVTPIIDSIPDYVDDGKTVVHYQYKNGDNNTDVEFFKIIGGEHEWIWYPNNDIDYTLEVWKFLSRYSKSPTSISKVIRNNNLSVFPNPAKGYFQLQVNNNSTKYTVQIFNELGVNFITKELESNNLLLQTDSFDSGIYYIKVNCNDNIYVEKLLIIKN